MTEGKSGGAERRLCIGMLAHVDAGKTTLSEALLYTAGAIRKPGRVDSRNTFLDTEAPERRRGITVRAKQAVFNWAGTRITLLDTPGHVDFSAETERVLSVLDLAVLVISGADGVQSHTETLWRLLEHYKVPVFLFINKMDQERLSAEELMEGMRGRLDEACLNFSGACAGGAQEKTARGLTGGLAESLAMCGEAALDEYLSTGSVSDGQVRELIRQRRVFPCFFGSALKISGIKELLGGIARWGSAAGAGTDFGARVFKISRDAQGTRLTHVKIVGGSLSVRDLLPELGEKVSQIRVYSGAKYSTVQTAPAGCVCALAGLSASRAGQGLGVLAGQEPPLLTPVLSYQVILPEGTDVHQALGQLMQLEEEEPELSVRWDEAEASIRLQVMGQVQMEIVKAQAAERFGLALDFGAGAIVYRETITEAAEGAGHFEPLRHYAEVHLRLEPLPAGSGIEYVCEVPEDELDRNWQRLIIGSLAGGHVPGVLAGAQLSDLRIVLTAGRAHAKHTEGGDFRQAAFRALRQGLMKARQKGSCRLLEPWYAFSLEVPSGQAGRAMADLDRMQAEFGAPVQGAETVTLSGRAPVSTMQDYQREAAAYTKGRGRLSLRLEGYFPCHDAEAVLELIGYEPEADVSFPAGSVFCAHGAGFAVPWQRADSFMHVTPAQKKGARPADAGELDEKGGDLSGAAGPSGRGAGGAGRQTPVPYSAADRELEEIFARTYGAPKRRGPGNSGPRQVTGPGQAGSSAVPVPEGPVGPKPGYMKKHQERMDEYLLVDGYNILHAWDELRRLMEVTLDGARRKLMDLLCNYQGFRGGHVILVFDAYRVPGGTGSVENYHNIQVVYTKEAETADQYIEKCAHELGRSNRVTVATSDGLEQLIIRGQGCLLMSAADLLEDMERTNRQIAEESGRLAKPAKRSVFAGIEEEIEAYRKSLPAEAREGGNPRRG